LVRFSLPLKEITMANDAILSSAVPATDDRNQTTVYRQIPISALPLNSTLPCAVHGPDGVKLIAAGIQITDAFLRRLEARNIKKVLISESAFVQVVPQLASPRSAAGFACPNCMNSLPLREAANDEWSATWLCKKCNTQFRGHLDPELAQKCGQNVGILRFPIRKDHLIHPPVAITQAINTMVPKPYAGPERRENTRMRITMPVAAVPLDEFLHPVGQPGMLITRDISVTGIALLHDEPWRPKYMVVELPAVHPHVPLQLVVEVLRCKPIESLYEIAGRFVMRPMV
jgi:predicted RNA-binding Zn-ribbon protein involved in translation (DUF1610 family)